ncbi:Ribonuclease P protein component [Planktothrix tepida]|uniref:Ribonuclease P protein component n=3 Tax=Planktothrix TaxID=54304 RepID=A0A1J1LJT6_9CYAN|nr:MULTISPECIES: ribonuclease P protein component [Planktothrix]MBD2481369.1 ribonuclease P protein component [Planktothrix sp. FACHB-1365]MBE9142852.1 ribonuclease P protein component [Planktothrix mougeotii LEGE 06226]CAD5948845.1 Ribonuclease P protein component [Planktothrix tepida]CAD5961890.1 Ribonuclease P protein component [Planktothrix pseudagardhii]CUR32462.1 Ribonuclease P protein component [Planktothrix tepida PCC 9214]
MLPKINRLRHPKDFKAVYSKGLHRKTPHLTLRALRGQPYRTEKNLTNSASVHPTRMGISISQKVSKRAVVRNRIKRQIRAAWHQFLPQVSPGWDVVIVVKPTADQCNYAEILQELKQLLVEAEVLNGYTGGKFL